MMRLANEIPFQLALQPAFCAVTHHQYIEYHSNIKAMRVMRAKEAGGAVNPRTPEHSGVENQPKICPGVDSEKFQPQNMKFLLKT